MDDRAWRIAGLGTAALVVALSIGESADPDLGFHVATGRAVISEGAIPATNVLTFAEPEQPWINQQWLPATIFALALDHAGFAGTRAVLVVLVALTALLLLAAARALGARPTVAAAVIGLGAWGSSFRFVERPLWFSNLALAAVIAACASALARHRAGDARGATTRIALAGLAASIAIHLHAGALFSILALGAIAGGAALEHVVPGRVAIAPLRGAAAIGIAIAAAIALAGIALAVYHPYGLAVLGVPLRMASDPYLHEHIVEFRPPWDQPLRLLAPYWGFLAAVVLVTIASARRASLPFLACIALGIAVSLRHARFADLAWILAAAPVAALASELRAPAPARELALALAIGAAALLDRTAIAPPAIGPSPAVWPEPLFAAIDHTGARGPALVQDGWAGPYLARFWPRERVFFHPAFEAYSEAHYRLYQSIRYGEPGWDAALDRFGVELLVLKHTSAREAAFQEGRPNLRQHLAASDRFALVAFDELGSVWVRREGANAAIPGALGVDPDRLAFHGDPGGARRDLEVVVGRTPPTPRAAALLAIARAADGDRAGASALLDGASREWPGDPRIDAARAALARVH